MSGSPGETPRREVLRQASVSLERRLVVLWQVSGGSQAVPILTSTAHPSDHETKLDLNSTLRRWGVPVTPGSRWVGCSLDNAARWCLAPVRGGPAAPPPGGVERRSRERLTLELAGLCVGLIDRLPDAIDRRLPGPDRLLELSRQPSEIAQVATPLIAAAASAELCWELLSESWGTDTRLRPVLLHEFAHLREGLERALDQLRLMQSRAGRG